MTFSKEFSDIARKNRSTVSAKRSTVSGYGHDYRKIDLKTGKTVFSDYTTDADRDKLSYSQLGDVGLQWAITNYTGVELRSLMILCSYNCKYNDIRRTVKRIGRKHGIPESTWRKHLAKFKSDEVVKVTEDGFPEINPLFLWRGPSPAKHGAVLDWQRSSEERRLDAEEAAPESRDETEDVPLRLVKQTGKP